MGEDRLTDETIDDLVTAVAQTLRDELHSLAGPTSPVDDREFISRRTRESIAERKAAGMYKGGRLLPQARPIAPEIAERIVALSAEGLSSRQIARHLDASGVPTTRGAARWSHTAVLNVLRREAERC